MANRKTRNQKSPRAQSEAGDYRPATRILSNRRRGSALEIPGLLDQRRRVAHLELARTFDVERFHDAVLDEHRIPLRPHTHAARGEVERQTGRFGEIGAAVSHHPHGTGRLLIAAPGAHDERVVDRDAPDLVDPCRLERAGLRDITRHMLGRAGRREGAGQTEDGDRLADGRLFDIERAVSYTHLRAHETDSYLQRSRGKLVADFQHGAVLLELRRSKTFRP